MIDSKAKDTDGYFPKNISKDQSKDTGMAIVLISLLIAYFTRNIIFIALSILFLIINMIIPNIYRPLAKIWLGISNVLGTIMSKLLLTIIFFVLVTPVGIVRKIAGVDSLHLKKWKRDASSVFRVRDHTFQPEEIEKPY